MSRSVLRNQVLVLNKHWLAVHAFTAQQAISQMAAGASCGVDVSPDGMRVVTWEEWQDLPCRPYDAVIHTRHKNYRCPTTVVCCNYKLVPRKNQRFTLANIAKRDGFRDGYTGEVLTNPDDWSLDHVDPRGQGGPNVPENVVLQKKKDNNKKGCRTPEQAGLKRPVIRPMLPQTPVETIELTHPDHALFIGQFKRKL